MTTETYDFTPRLFIAGKWRQAASGDTIDLVNPATGERIAGVPKAGREDLDEALAAVAAANSVWRSTTAFDRAKIMRKAADLLRERAPHIGRLTTMEQGKPLFEATMEVHGCAEILDWYADEGRRAYGRIIPSKFPGVRALVVKEPIGPVAAFTPWNFPIAIAALKIAPALAAGCPVIIKPAEETPASALEIARALDDAGLPKGVLNVVFGVPSEVSSYLIASPIIRKISFTGSTAIGKHLARLAADVMKPTTMELGGHAPVIVFEDADIEKAVQMTAAAKFVNAGQICVAPTRFFLHDSIHDKFVDEFAKMASSVKVGNGLDPDSKMGALANPRRIAAMSEMVADAEANGGRIVAGGSRLSDQGNFWQPTLVADVPDDARIMNEEPFGPIAVTQRFDNFDSVMKSANRLPFGLAAYAFTRSTETIAKVSDQIESGMIGINFVRLVGPEAPFVGVKDSGHGSDGGPEAMDGYMITKYVAEGL